jgi:HEAT repeat protein
MSFLRKLFGGREKKPEREAEQPSPPVTEVEADPVPDPVPLTPEEQAKALVGQLRLKNTSSSAARELSKLGADAVEPLIAALRQGDIEVRRAAARILGRIGDPRAVDPLVNIALGMDPKPLRADADKALLAIGEPALASIIEGLKRPGGNALAEAADLLGRMGDPQAVAPLAAALHFAPGYRRGYVVKALGQIGGEPAVVALVEALRYQNARSAAARWLARFGEGSVAPLIAVLGDEDAGSAAARVLVKIGAPAVEPLIATLGDSDPAVRRAAVGALQKLAANTDLEQSLREAASAAAEQVDTSALDAELSKRPAKPKPRVSKTSPRKSPQDAIRDLFNAEHLSGTRIDAVAILYQEARVAPPPPQQLARMIVNQFRQPGFISHSMSFSPRTSVEMREATIAEAVDIKSINKALALMLARQLKNKDLSGYTAMSLRGDTGALGTIWFAVAVR